MAVTTQRLPYQTKKPTGQKITREGNAFTFSWKIADKDYSTGQSLQWRVNSGAWTNKSISATATSATVTVNFSNYAPSADKLLMKIEFRVKGTRANFVERSSKYIKYYFPTPSEWATCAKSFERPDKAVITATWDDEAANQTVFSWTADASNTNFKFNRRCDYESVLVERCNYSDGKKAPWVAGGLDRRNGTSAGAGGSATIVEDQTIANGSYTRWIRVRTRGVRGAGDWAYSKHVYAKPYTPENLKVIRKTKTASGYTVTAKWDANATLAHPIDSMSLQYINIEPLAGMVCPSTDQWETAATVMDTNVRSGLAFDVPTRPTTDQALYVRVLAQHDDRIADSAPVMVAAGPLANPTGLSVSVNTSTKIATINATNECAIPGSFLAVYYSTPKKPTPFVIAIIPNGQTSVTNVKCPDDDTATMTFGVQAVVGSYTAKTPTGGVSSYTVDKLAESEIVNTGGTVPAAPRGITATQAGVPGSIKVTWPWSWAEATFAELSWSDNPNAWNSTDQPERFEVDRTNESEWYISGLDAGITWYVRVRLGKTTGNETTYGQYSEVASVDLASAPSIPVLTLSRGIVALGDTFEASWTYVTNDGTPQASAELAEVIVSGGVTTYRTLATTQTAQRVTLNPRTLKWLNGSSHNLVVRVASASGQMCNAWSEAVSIGIAPDLTATISATSLVNGELTEMPFTATVAGAGLGGITTLAIERAEPYEIDRPDESVFNGYEGETIAIFTQFGSAQITIDLDDLIGTLDDGADYRVVATVQDTFGRSAQATPIPFTVNWTEKAIEPDATESTIDPDKVVAFLYPVAPEGASETATCDIYRMSVDKPVLIYRDATFGETYVDPYPTLGQFGRHRFVYKTATGSYITSDGRFAWTDVDYDEYDIVNPDWNIIEWEGGRVELTNNIDLSTDWDKDFTQTQYLGGSIQGDWNPGVRRSGSVTGMIAVDAESDTVEALRRLATYAGICHVRTKDGSNFAADVQVSEDLAQKNAHRIASFGLKITRVDSETLDGMTLAEWEETQEEEEP